MKDQFDPDRFLISSPVVVLPRDQHEGAEMDWVNDAMVPMEAWLAADDAFDEDPSIGQGDELSRALQAASPHLRIHELDRAIEALESESGSLRNIGLRAGLRRAAEILSERRDELKKTVPS